MASDPSHSSSIQFQSLQAPLLVMIGAAVYLGTLACDFAYDDVLWVVDNELIRSPRNLPHFFSSGQLGQRVYRPMALVSFALDYAVAGVRPWFYHAENALLHGLVCLLVYRLFQPMGRRTAWLTAALFAVLPVHREVVSNVSGRSELLATLLGLAALLQLRRPLLAGALLLLALMAKETAVAIPALAAVLWWRSPSRPPLAKMSTTMLALSGAVGLFLLIRPLANCCTLFPENLLHYQTDNPLLLADWSTRLRTALMMPGQNLAACLLPFSLAVDSPPALLVTRWSDPRLLLWVLLPLALAGGCLAVRRFHANAACGLGWFLVAVLPLSNIFLLIGVVRADRLLYLASAGVCLMVAEAAAVALEVARRPATVLVVAVLISLGAVTARGAMDWRTQESIVFAGVRDSPRSAEAHQLLATCLRTSGHCAAAIPVYRRALELYPEYLHAQGGLAVCLEQTGDLAGAQRMYLAASTALPADEALAQGLSRVCAARRDWACVASTMRRLITANPLAARNEQAWIALGNALLFSGHAQEAESAFRRALQYGNPPVAHFNLAGLLIRQGQTGEAIEHYRAAEQAGMRREELYVDYAQAMKRQGAVADARKLAARGLAYFPDSAELKRLSR